MAQAFTITTNLFSFTATVQTNVQGISLSTTPLSVTQVNPGFTATVVRSDLTVNSTDSAVTILPEAVNVFTSTQVDYLIGVVEQTQATVTVTNVAEAISVNKPETPITINYNPTLVEHVYDGQPVYTTSTPTFKNIVLGNTSTFTFPADDGTSGFALLTDGDGQLYWGPAGGGGGPGFWSLNDDLITNGFKINSGSDSVDLKLQGGGKLLDLDPSRTYLGTGTSYLNIQDGVELRDGNNRIQVSSTNIRLQNSNAGIEVGDDLIGTGHADFRYGSARFRASEGNVIEIDNNTAAVGAEELEYGKIRFESKTITVTAENIDIGSSSNINLNGQITADNINAESITGPSGPAVAPQGIRFGDGTVLNTANIGTGTQYFTSTQLTSDLYQNGFNIWSNNGRIRAGTASLVVYSSTATQGIHQEGLIVEGALGSGFNLNGYRAELNVPNALGEIVLNAPKVYLAGDLRFPDGSVQTTAIPNTGSVLTVVANTGISVSTSTGNVVITNTGVRKALPGLGISIKSAPYGDPTAVNTTTGDLYIGIEELPITQGYGMIVDQTGFEGYTVLSVNSATLANNIIAGNGISVTRSDGQVTIATTSALVNNLTADLKTNGFKIDGESNRLDIEAGKFNFLGSTLSSRISMPFNSAMRITSDYGIVLDTPDDKTIQILSPLTVLHRDGSSRISTDALGQTTLNDTRIAITGTNRVVINQSSFFEDNITLRSTTTSASLFLGPTKAIITATEIVLATTATVKIGSDIYNSQLAVQDIVNYNGTGPVTVSKGIQFPDTTVQRTAYIGGLDFGAITAPATNLEQFLLQLQSVDFGTATSPSTLAFDAGVIE